MLYLLQDPLPPLYHNRLAHQQICLTAYEKIQIFNWGGGGALLCPSVCNTWDTCALRCFVPSLRGCPSTRIMKTQRLKTHFFEKLEKSENAALPFSCGQRICILSKRMKPSAPPRWTPRLLITTTTTMSDYCLCSCFLQLTYLECEAQQQFELIIAPHKPFWFPCTSYFRLLLLVFGFSFYCLFVNSANFKRMLCLFFSFFGEFQAPPRGLEYELQHFESFSVDPCGRKYSWNDAEKEGEKKIIWVRVDKV